MMLTMGNIGCANDFEKMADNLDDVDWNVVDGVVQEESDGGKSRLLVAQ